LRVIKSWKKISTVEKNSPRSGNSVCHLNDYHRQNPCLNSILSLVQSPLVQLFEWEKSLRRNGRLWSIWSVFCAGVEASVDAPRSFERGGWDFPR
jgi:hypothetical protein